MNSIFSSSSFCKNKEIKHFFFNARIPGSTHQYRSKVKNDDSSTIMSNHQAALKEANLSLKQINIVDQIHSNIVIIIDKPVDLNNLPQADAIITTTPNLAIGVYTADCVPIIIADHYKKIVAIIHAGWKGALSDIIKKCIVKMQKLGANNLSAIIGPCIQQQNYEVSQDFYNIFYDKNSAYTRYFSPGKFQHFYFNLPQFAKDKLIDSGIDEISDININTYDNETECFSYRRDTHLGLEYKKSHLSIAVIK